MDLVRRMQHHGPTIFTEITALAQQHGAVNLGQGFPDTDGPPEMLAAAIRAIGSGQNQETELRAAFSDRTRLVLLNSPHNPTGKVFSRPELELIARLAIEHDDPDAAPTLLRFAFCKADDVLREGAARLGRLAG